MIPDKIYLGIQDLGSGYVYNLSLDNNGEQEYIRKSALLEWAKDWKDSGPIKDSADNGDAWSIGYLSAMADIIMKLNNF